MKEIEFLEIIIKSDEIKIKKEKINRILNWLTFQKVINIQEFLRLANYYQQFIKDFIFIRLLYDIVKKN